MVVLWEGGGFVQARCSRHQSLSCEPYTLKSKPASEQIRGLEDEVGDTLWQRKFALH